MAVRFGGLPVEQVFDSNGDPLAGAKLSFFDTGTATPHNTFSDDALTTPNANPVVADSAGRFGAIFLDSADYKVVLKTSADVTIWTADPVHGGAVNPLFSSIAVKSGNYTILSGDNGKLIPVTATATITLPAATVGATFRVGIANAGAGIVTVARAGADTIGTGLTSLKLAPNQGAFFQSDGTSKFYVVGFDGRGKGADIASAATLNIGEDGDYFHVTGTTTITAIEGRPTGFEITLEFDSALTLTHNAVSLIMLTGADVVVAPGDIMKFVSEADGGNWRCLLHGYGINDLSEDTAPDLLLDFVQTFDASTNRERKVLLRNAMVFPAAHGSPPNISNSAAETTIFSVTVPANTLNTTNLRALHVCLFFELLNNTAATHAFTLRVKLGATTLYADTSALLAASAIARPVVLELWLYTQSAGVQLGQQFVSGFLRIGNIVAATTGIGDLATDATQNTNFSSIGGIENAATDLVFAVTVQLDAASAVFSLTGRGGFAELI